MSEEDFQQNNEHGGYPIVVKLPGNFLTRFWRWLVSHARAA